MATTRPATAGQRRAPTDRRRGLRPDRPRPPLEPRHHPIPAPLARALFPHSRPSLRLRPHRAPRAARQSRAHGELTPRPPQAASAPSDARPVIASPSSVARLLLGPRRRSSTSPHGAHPPPP
ncbi:hypothetical protein U9M48_016694 [Paspalum notatum var. saurae]|uniref:Uncharacterized protein n=1 Tax=Paspalum notatum var. saurae TaxID=547442 RepID=A0AAQ3T9D8_PASNO